MLSTTGVTEAVHVNDNCTYKTVTITKAYICGCHAKWKVFINAIPETVLEEDHSLLKHRRTHQNTVDF